LIAFSDSIVPHLEQNILVGDDNLVKIADFGISKMLENGSAQKLVDAGGTPAFMAPELCSSAEAFSGQLVDIWAIGATMYMLRFGQPPFVAGNVLALYNKIINDPLEFPPVAIDPGLRNLLVNMLEKDPALRYNMDQITSHPWLRFAPRPTTVPFVLQTEHASIKSGKHVLQLSDQYFNEEAEAMKGPKKTVDREEIYRSIGYGIEKNHHSEDSGDSGDEGIGSKAENALEEKSEEDIMATNWASDVFEQVDDEDLESDDESVDDVPSAPNPEDTKVIHMDESEQDRRSKEFKQKLIAKSSAANFIPSGGSLRTQAQSKISTNDGDEDEFGSPQQKRINHKESLDIGDVAEELSMDDFEDMMDTLAMRPVSKMSQPHQPTDTPFLLEHVEIDPHSVNIRSGLGGVSYSDQGCRRTQEDRAVLVINLGESAATETGHFDYLLNFSVAAIFDGHSGERCSNLLANNFVRSMLMNQDFYSTKTLKQSMITSCSDIDTQVSSTHFSN
jgi:serine/threonine protein kinase